MRTESVTRTFWHGVHSLHEVHWSVKNSVTASRTDTASQHMTSSLSILPLHVVHYCRWLFIQFSSKINELIKRICRCDSQKHHRYARLTSRQFAEGSLNMLVIVNRTRSQDNRVINQNYLTRTAHQLLYCSERLFLWVLLVLTEGSIIFYLPLDSTRHFSGKNSGADKKKVLKCIMKKKVQI